MELKQYYLKQNGKIIKISEEERKQFTTNKKREKTLEYNNQE